MRNTLSEILSDFGPDESSREVKETRPVTIWIPADAKARYDRLQEKSGRRFSKKARETLIALIAAAEAMTA